MLVIMDTGLCSPSWFILKHGHLEHRGGLSDLAKKTRERQPKAGGSVPHHVWWPCNHGCKYCCISSRYRHVRPDLQPMLQICGGTSTHVMDRDSDHKISHDPSLLCMILAVFLQPRLQRWLQKEWIPCNFCNPRVVPLTHARGRFVTFWVSLRARRRTNHKKYNFIVYSPLLLRQRH